MNRETTLEYLVIIIPWDPVSLVGRKMKYTFLLMQSVQYGNELGQTINDFFGGVVLFLYPGNSVSAARNIPDLLQSTDRENH